MKGMDPTESLVVVGWVRQQGEELGAISRCSAGATRQMVQFTEIEKTWLWQEEGEQFSFGHATQISHLWTSKMGIIDPGTTQV